MTMTDLKNLLDQIDRLDQQATKGPWHKDGDEILGAPYKECGYLKAPHVGETYGTERDAEFIALARTFAPAAAKALRAVMELHKPETRWSYEPSPEWGFSTKVELFEFFDLDNEPHDPADVTQWQLCIHCAEVEQGAAEDLGHLTALYPCGTVQAITDDLKGDDDGNDHHMP